MSIENASSFWAAANADPRLEGELRAIKADGRAEAIAEVVKVASAAGYAFTCDDYEAAVRARVNQYRGSDNPEGEQERLFDRSQPVRPIITLLHCYSEAYTACNCD